MKLKCKTIIFSVLMYYTFKNTFLTKDFEIHMVYISCNNTIV